MGPSTRWRKAAAVAAAIAAGACGYGPLGPELPDDLRISFVRAGGIAGIHQHVVIDADDRSMALGCGPLCLGPLNRVPVSSAAILDVARELEDAGVLAFDGTDFGEECCDIFHAALTYERDGQSAELRGSTTRWPSAFTRALDRLTAFSDGAVPMLVATTTTPSDWPSTAFEIEELEVDGRRLEVEMRHGGGCGDHRFDLVAHGDFLESNPVQIDVYLAHDGDGDLCDAIVTSERSFDLGPLVEAYAAAYGGIPFSGGEVVMRLTTPSDSEPRLISVTF